MNKNYKTILITNPDHTILTLGYKTLFLGENTYIDKQYKHLFILSDDTIRVGDWCYSDIIKKVFCVIDGSDLKYYNISEAVNKIIATTNHHLELPLIHNSYLQQYVEAFNDGVINIPAILAEQKDNGELIFTMNSDEKISLYQALLFAQWIGEKKYTKHQSNDRWYDSEMDYNYIGSTIDLMRMFENDTEWLELKKEKS